MEGKASLRKISETIVSDWLKDMVSRKRWGYVMLRFLAWVLSVTVGIRQKDHLGGKIVQDWMW